MASYTIEAMRKIIKPWNSSKNYKREFEVPCDLIGD